jgi:dihydrofolate synthase/folylpolyglutamate synthase
VHGPRSSDAILDRLLSLHPKIIDLTLDRVWRLLAAMGEPQRRLPPVVHIAGTNGKGSTLAMIRAGMEAGGKAVHAYTSPHLARFHERIRIAGELIREPALAALLEECERVNGDQPITFFEITTVAAYVAFARAEADYTLLEVGLGGRLDATNVIDRPALTVITPVSIDHQQYLGETLAEIAFEKAGILKPDIPCVVGPQADAAREVIEARATELGAPLFIHGQDWIVRTEHGRLVYEDTRGLLDLDECRACRGGAARAGLWRDRLPGGAGASGLARPDAAPDPGSPGRADGRADARRRDPVARWRPQRRRWRGTGGRGCGSPSGGPVADHGNARHQIGGGLSAPAGAACGRRCHGDDPRHGGGNSGPGIGQTGGLQAQPADSVMQALDAILAKTHGSTPDAPLRVLICGSLYLAGAVLQENG